MKYVYFMMLDEKGNYKSFHCCEVTGYNLVGYNPDATMYSCNYKYQGKVRHRKVYMEEGRPYDRYCTFYLNERDDERAREIMKNAIKSFRDKRKKRIRDEYEKIQNENNLLNKLPSMRPKYN